MINRFLIRVKVIQALYSYVLNRPDRTVKQAVHELQNSFDKSYELYFYFLQLIVELTNMQDRRLDDARNKFLPTEEEMNPDTRFIDNRLVKLLNANEDFSEYCEHHNVSWTDDIVFMRLLLDKVLNSDYYKAYMQRGEQDTTLGDDCELWRNLIKNVLANDEDFIDHIENMSVHWSIEDCDMMSQFAIKTIRRFETGDDKPIMPMYKDEEDARFGEDLFGWAIDEMEENNMLIDKAVDTSRWSHERVALMDRIIMCAAISEMRHYYLTIPVSVTLNEYIELAKIFSTPNSGQFVNGVLNGIAHSLDLPRGAKPKK